MYGRVRHAYALAYALRILSYFLVITFFCSNICLAHRWLKMTSRVKWGLNSSFVHSSFLWWSPISTAGLSCPSPPSFFLNALPGINSSTIKTSVCDLKTNLWTKEGKLSLKKCTSCTTQIPNVPELVQHGCKLTELQRNAVLQCSPHPAVMLRRMTSLTGTSALHI